MKVTRRLTIVAVALTGTLTLTGCSIIEDFIPGNEQPTVTVFDEPDTAANSDLDENDSGLPVIGELDNETSGTAEDAPGTDSSGTTGSPQPTVPATPATATNTTVEETFTMLDTIIQITRNTCTVNDTLGLIAETTTETFPAVPNSKPVTYTIMHVPESEKIVNTRTIAYYTTENGISPEILEDYTPTACFLTDGFSGLRKNFTEEDLALTAPAPDNITLTQTANTYQVKANNKQYTITVDRNQISKVVILDTENRTLITNVIVKASISKSDTKNFESLYYFTTS